MIIITTLFVSVSRCLLILIITPLQPHWENHVDNIAANNYTHGGNQHKNTFGNASDINLIMNLIHTNQYATVQ